MNHVKRLIKKRLDDNNCLLIAPLIVLFLGCIHIICLYNVISSNLRWTLLIAGACYLILIAISLSIYFTRRVSYKEVLQWIEDEE